MNVSPLQIGLPLVGQSRETRENNTTDIMWHTCIYTYKSIHVLTYKVDGPEITTIWPIVADLLYWSSSGPTDTDQDQNQ